VLKELVSKFKFVMQQSVIKAKRNLQLKQSVKVFQSLMLYRRLPKNNENWMIFKLEQTDGVNYSWKLLPYGQYKEYISGMKFRDNKILYYGALALTIYGAYSVLKMFAK
jgi:hypothetical protein